MPHTITDISYRKTPMTVGDVEQIEVVLYCEGEGVVQLGDVEQTVSV